MSRRKPVDNCWQYKGDCMTTPPEGYCGFVYKITLLTAYDTHVAGTIYVGKKIFTHKKKTRLSKKARVGTRKRIKVAQVDSNWMNYFGSCKELKELVKELGPEHFKREVLHLCKSKAEMTYYEVHEQVLQKVFLTPSFNGWISCKVYKKQFLCK